MAVLIPLVQKMPVGFPWSLLVSLLIVVFGFFFVAVSSRIVGLIGSSSNPISGMTIATLLGTCLVFVACGLGRAIRRQQAAARRRRSRWARSSASPPRTPARRRRI